MTTTKYYDSLGNELFPLIIDDKLTYLFLNTNENGYIRTTLGFNNDTTRSNVLQSVVDSVKPISGVTIPREEKTASEHVISFNNYPVAQTDDNDIIYNTFMTTIKHNPDTYYISGSGNASNSVNSNTSHKDFFTWQGSTSSDTAFLVFKQYGILPLDTNNNILGVVYTTIGYNIYKDGTTDHYKPLGDSYGWDYFGGKQGTWDNIIIYPLGYTGKDLDNTSNTTIGGGYGSGNNPHDTIEIPQLPNLVLSNTGSSLYALTSPEMLAFSSWLWSSDWTENIKKLRTDPMQNIIGISVIDISLTGNASTIHVGNLNSGVNASLISNWVSVDCGSINVEEYYGTFADYEPYIALTLYLPKVGFVQIPADAVVNNSIKIVYNIELTSGEGLCYIYIVNNRDNFSYVYNAYTCHVSANVALSASDHTQQISAIINASINTVTAVGGAIATGGATAGSAATTVASSALNVATTKNPTQTKGNFGNFGTLMCVKKPYLIINRTNLTKPSSFQENNGYMINYTATIGDHTGFLQTRDYHCKFNAPYNHKAEIENILNGGVIINA